MNYINQIKQIIIPSGGLGTRLYPMTKDVPKCLIPINGHPFIKHQINLIKKNDISEVILCIGMHSQKIIDYLKNNSDFGISIKYSIEDTNNLLGTLGALKKAEKLLEENFFVVWGDSYLDIDYQKIANTFFRSKKLGLLTVYKNKNQLFPSNTSINDGLVINYDKKKSSEFEYIDFGLSVFQKKVLDFFPSKRRLDLSDLNKKLISMEQLAAFEVKDRFYEIGSIKGIKDLGEYLKTK